MFGDLSIAYRCAGDDSHATAWYLDGKTKRVVTGDVSSRTCDRHRPDADAITPNGALVVSSGVYGPNDPDRCPKRTRIELETLDGIKLPNVSAATVPIITFPGFPFSVPEKS